MRQLEKQAEPHFSGGNFYGIIPTPFQCLIQENQPHLNVLSPFRILRKSSNLILCFYQIKFSFFF